MAISSPKFQELYQKLNPEQKEAVDAVEGPVMVIAGPGTGKTQMLTLRIANILLKTQINPGNVLALTFSENGAAAMKKRLAEIIGPTAYQVNISTFHSFCNNLIQNYPNEFPEIIGRQPSDEIKQIELLQKIIDSTRLEFLKPFGEPYFYLPTIRQTISRLKKEAVEPEEFEALVAKEKKSFSTIDDLYYESGRYKGRMRGKYADLKKHLDKNSELAKVYHEYQEALAESKLYDYDDMILQVAGTLSNSRDFLLRLQEQFQYFLVDEHQDTNNAQNKVLKLLSSFFVQPNLFVVGDEKQTVFRFQGASLENFLYFKKIYPEARLISLNKNYRSTQAILDLTHSVIQNNSLRLVNVMPEVKDELFAQAGHKEQKIEAYEFKRPEAESYFLGEKISELIKSGALAKEIAVIYRDNKDAIAVANILSKYGLPFRVESLGNALEDEDIKKLLNIFKFVDNPAEEEKLFPILCSDWLNIPALDVYKLTSPNVRRGPLLELAADGERLKELKIVSFKEVGNLTANLLNWHKSAQNAMLSDLFERIARESGFLNYILAKPDSALKLAKLNSLFGEIKKIAIARPEARLTDFVNYLATLEKYKVGIKEGGLGYIPLAVRLMTAHGAKGLEFDYVFVVNAFDGHWGNRRVPQLIKLPSLLNATLQGAGDEEKDLKNDDERRLFFVALTRARKMVYISYALRGLDGRERTASQFVTEIKPELKTVGDAERYETGFEKRSDLFFGPAKDKGFSVFEKEYLRDLFGKRGLSATAVNNFLVCPWKYFYLNLLRIPKSKSRFQIYGSAVHAGLKNFFDQRDDGKLDILLTGFRGVLEKESLSKNDFEEFLRRGNETLKKYFEFYADSWNMKTQNEFRIQNIFLGDSIKLTGSLDKIEQLSDLEVNVVDYKTGKAKSRNELEGKTKNATGDYKRQLVFYKLLLDLHPTAKLNMVSGELDFVEPDRNGIFRKEKFLVDENEVNELKNTIFSITDKVINFKFENEKCNDKNCEFCRLRFGL